MPNPPSFTNMPYAAPSSPPRQYSGPYNVNTQGNQRRRAPSNSSYGSSSSSSVLDISRHYPQSRYGGFLGTFFKAPSERRRRNSARRAARSSKRRTSFYFGGAGNSSSSSSVNSDLAYGYGYIPKLHRRRSSRRDSGGSNSFRYGGAAAAASGSGSRSARTRDGDVPDAPPPRRPDGHGPTTRGKTDEEILDIGRQLSDLARKQNKHDLKAAGYVKPTMLAAAAAAGLGKYRKSRNEARSRGVGSSRIHGESSSDESDWEDASDDESDGADSVLAYGSVVSSAVRPTAAAGRSSYGVGPYASGAVMGSAGAAAAAALADPQRRSSVVDPRLFGPVNSLRGMINTPCGFGQDPHPAAPSVTYQTPADARRNGVESLDRRPMREVYPVPTSDPSRFDADAIIVQEELPHRSHTSTVPLEQPVPKLPVSSKVYEAEKLEDSSRRESRHGKDRDNLGKDRDSYAKDRDSYAKDRDSHGFNGSTVAGFAAAAIGATGVAALASDRKEDKKEKKALRERERERERDKEREREDRERERAREKDRNRDKEREQERERDRDRRDRDRELKRRDKDSDKEGKKSKRDSHSSSKYDDKDHKRHSKHADEDTPRKRRETEADHCTDSPSSRKDRSKREIDEPRSELSRSSKRDSNSYSSRDNRKEDKGKSVDRYDFSYNQGTPSSKVNPFLYQVSDGAFSTTVLPAVEAPADRPLTPNIVTIDREPNFDDYEPYLPLEPSESRLSRKDSFEIQERPQDYQVHPKRYDHGIHVYEEGEHEASSIYDQAKHATIPVAAAAVASAIAVETERSRERRRGQYDEEGSRDRGSWRRDTVQEEADKYYRESVIARKIEEEQMRSQTPENDTSRQVRIVTPPEMHEQHKNVGPYDAPNADVRIDNQLFPKEANKFDKKNGKRKSNFKSRDPSCERDRPVLNLVFPTPIPSREPTPRVERQTPRDQRETRTRSDPSAEVAIGPKGDIVKIEPSNKSVSWGENSTKSFEVESADGRSDVEKEKVVEPEDKPRVRLTRASPWSMVAAAVAGSGSEPSGKPDTVSERKYDTEDYSSKIPDIQEISQTQPEQVYNVDTRDQPPVPGPKPTSPPRSTLPGSFADDVEFAATLAAGLKDTGFDSNIVVDDPTYRRRDSPPGTKEANGDEWNHKSMSDIVMDITNKKDSSRSVVSEPAGITRDRPVNDHSNGGDEWEAPKKLSGGRDTEAEPAAEPEIVSESVEHSYPTEDTVDNSWEDSSSKKKKKKDRKSQEMAAEESITVPTDAFDDLQSLRKSDKDDTVSTAVEEWDNPSKSKRKSKSDKDDTVSTAIEEWDTPSKSKRKSKSDRDESTRSVAESELSTSSKKSSKSKRRSGTEGDFDGYGSDRSKKSSRSKHREGEDGYGSDVSKKSSKSKRRSGAEGDFDGYGSDRSKKSSRSKHREGDDGYGSDRSKKSSRSKHREGDDGYGSDRSKKSSKSKHREGDDGYGSDMSRKSSKSKRRSGAEGDFDYGSDIPSRRRSLFDDRDVSSVVSEARGDGRRREREKDKDRDRDRDRDGRSSSKRSSRNYDDDDDARSVVSVASAPGGIRKSKDSKRSSGLFASIFKRDDDKKEKESFLDNAGTLGAGVGLAGAAAIVAASVARSNATDRSGEAHKDDDSHQTSRVESYDYDTFDPEIAPRAIKPAIDPQYGDLLPLPPSEPGSPRSEPGDFPPLPDSRPDTPPEEHGMRRDQLTHRRRRSTQETPVKSPSNTAIPLSLRLGQRPPSSPSGTFKSPPTSSSAQTSTAPDSTAKRASRGTSWDSSREFKPLYLVEHSRHGSAETIAKQEDLPALPPSISASEISFTEDNSPADFASSGLHIDTQDLPHSFEQHGGSQETTPKAEIRPQFPSHEEQGPVMDPNAVDSMSKDRSSYLLDSTPSSTKTTATLDSELSQSDPGSTPSKHRRSADIMPEITEDLTSADERFEDALDMPSAGSRRWSDDSVAMQDASEHHELAPDPELLTKEASAPAEESGKKNKKKTQSLENDALEAASIVAGAAALGATVLATQPADNTESAEDPQPDTELGPSAEATDNHSSVAEKYDTEPSSSTEAINNNAYVADPMPDTELSSSADTAKALHTQTQLGLIEGKGLPTETEPSAIEAEPQELLTKTNDESTKSQQLDIQPEVDSKSLEELNTKELLEQETSLPSKESVAETTLVEAEIVPEPQPDKTEDITADATDEWSTTSKVSKKDKKKKKKKSLVLDDVSPEPEPAAEAVQKTPIATGFQDKDLSAEEQTTDITPTEATASSEPQLEKAEGTSVDAGDWWTSSASKSDKKNKNKNKKQSVLLDDVPAEPEPAPEAKIEIPMVGEDEGNALATDFTATTTNVEQNQPEHSLADLAADPPTEAADTKTVDADAAWPVSTTSKKDKKKKKKSSLSIIDNAISAEEPASTTDDQPSVVKDSGKIESVSDKDPEQPAVLDVYNDKETSINPEDEFAVVPQDKKKKKKGKRKSVHFEPEPSFSPEEEVPAPEDQLKTSDAQDDAAVPTLSTQDTIVSAQDTVFDEARQDPTSADTTQTDSQPPTDLQNDTLDPDRKDKKDTSQEVWSLVNDSASDKKETVSSKQMELDDVTLTTATAEFDQNLDSIDVNPATVTAEEREKPDLADVTSAVATDKIEAESEDEWSRLISGNKAKEPEGDTVLASGLTDEPESIIDVSGTANEDSEFEPKKETPSPTEPPLEEWPVATGKKGKKGKKNKKSTSSVSWGEPETQLDTTAPTESASVAISEPEALSKSIDAEASMSQQADPAAPTLEPAPEPESVPAQQEKTNQDDGSDEMVSKLSKKDKKKKKKKQASMDEPKVEPAGLAQPDEAVQKTEPVLPTTEPILSTELVESAESVQPSSVESTESIRAIEPQAIEPQAIEPVTLTDPETHQAVSEAQIEVALETSAEQSSRESEQTNTDKEPDGFSAKLSKKDKKKKKKKQSSSAETEAATFEPLSPALGLEPQAEILEPTASLVSQSSDAISPQQENVDDDFGVFATKAAKGDTQSERDESVQTDTPQDNVSPVEHDPLVKDDQPAGEPAPETAALVTPVETNPTQAEVEPTVKMSERESISQAATTVEPETEWGDLNTKLSKKDKKKAKKATKEAISRTPEETLVEEPATEKTVEQPFDAVIATDSVEKPIESTEPSPQATTPEVESEKELSGLARKPSKKDKKKKKKSLSREQEATSETIELNPEVPAIESPKAETQEIVPDADEKSGVKEAEPDNSWMAGLSKKEQKKLKKKGLTAAALGAAAAATGASMLVAETQETARDPEPQPPQEVKDEFNSSSASGTSETEARQFTANNMSKAEKKKVKKLGLKMYDIGESEPTTEEVGAPGSTAERLARELPPSEQPKSSWAEEMADNDWSPAAEVKERDPKTDTVVPAGEPAAAESAFSTFAPTETESPTTGDDTLALPIKKGKKGKKAKRQSTLDVVLETVSTEQPAEVPASIEPETAQEDPVSEQTRGFEVEWPAPEAEAAAAQGDAESTRNVTPMEPSKADQPISLTTPETVEEGLRPESGPSFAEETITAPVAESPAEVADDDWAAPTRKKSKKGKKGKSAPLSDFEDTASKGAESVPDSAQVSTQPEPVPVVEDEWGTTAKKGKGKKGKKMSLLAWEDSIVEPSSSTVPVEAENAHTPVAITDYESAFVEEPAAIPDAAVQDKDDWTAPVKKKSKKDKKRQSTQESYTEAEAPTKLDAMRDNDAAKDSKRDDATTIGDERQERRFEEAVSVGEVERDDLPEVEMTRSVDDKFSSSDSKMTTKEDLGAAGGGKKTAGRDSLEAVGAAAALTGGVAALAQMYGGGKKKKGKKSKIVDKRQPQGDDLFDDPAVWEGPDKKNVVEESRDETLDDGVDEFWGPSRPDPGPSVAPHTPISTSFTESGDEWKETARQGVSVDDEFVESPILGRGDSVLLRSTPAGLLRRDTKPEEPAGGPLDEAPRGTPSRQLSTELSEVRSSPTRALPAVQELPEAEKLAATGDLWPMEQANRDSGFIPESPPRRRSPGFVDEKLRDSGVDSGDWREPLHTQTPEAHSRAMDKRLGPSPLNTPVLQEPPRDKTTTPVADPDKKLRRSNKDYGGLAAVAAGSAVLTAEAAHHGKGHDNDRRAVSDSHAAIRSGRAESTESVARRSVSNTSLSRQRTPEPLKLRPESPGSILGQRSTATPTPPPLRRVDKRMSGDLRALRQQNNSTPPVANEARVRTKDMADVYDGFGEGRLGSPRSPTRPHSMRRRQSMQVLELESRVDQLLAENRLLTEARNQAEQNANRSATSVLSERDAEIDALKQSLQYLQNEVNRLTEVNEGLTSANAELANKDNTRYAGLAVHGDGTRSLEGPDATSIKTLEEKDAEIASLREQLEAAKEQVREMQRQILASKAADAQFLNIRDEDYFDNRCQQLCSHVQQWVLRFSKFSDMRACRLTSEINDEKTIDRLDNAVLDGSDVDIYLNDRVKRRDIFMSMTMSMIWEFVFTRYLFGMDREQRQKLKSLEKLLTEVGPQNAVRQWRAVTLTLLAKRASFQEQRELDTEAVVQAIFQTLCKILPPPSNLENQIQSQLRRVMREAVDLSIAMRTQQAEYMMLPPLQPEYDADGELAATVQFNASMMNERNPQNKQTNEEIEADNSIVRIVLFPLVVKKGDDAGVGDDEIVVCPAQVLVAREHGRRHVTPSSDAGGASLLGAPSRLSVVTDAMLSQADSHYVEGRN
ncbi:hypothetical protein BM221_008079 [Beauveria bassiana]|uniref:Involucrin repeat protein n=1 Tax=Beauveria bassiana TaxID=176275 RepID=A0A2N6NF43_BEABA|nr:hypothetical protein BM221_008079 [Beauveria bassiana]